MTLQQKLYTLFEEPDKSKMSYYLNIFIYVLIIISIINLMLITVAEYNDKYGEVFLLIRHIVMPFFVIEYLLRLYASGALEQYKGWRGKLKYALTPYAIIDLISILPYLLVYFAGIPNSSALRSLRLLRIFRLFRVRKYANFAKTMKRIFGNIKEEIIVLLLYTVIILVILSFVIFQIEHEAQPEVFSNVFQTMWWGIATLTTVGYGDMYPITAAGKFITSVITILGIAFIAIPGSLFASEFISEISEKKKRNREEEKVCPKCMSDDIVFYSHPDIKIDDEYLMYSGLSICNTCGFSWLENVDVPEGTKNER